MRGEVRWWVIFFMMIIQIAVLSLFLHFVMDVKNDDIFLTTTASILLIDLVNRRADSK